MNETAAIRPDHSNGGLIQGENVRYRPDGSLIVQRPSYTNTVRDKEQALKAAQASYLQVRRDFDALPNSQDVATLTRKAELIAQGHQLVYQIVSLSPKR